MALQQSHTWNQIAFSTAYFRIVELTLNLDQKMVDFLMVVYADQPARNSGAKPVCGFKGKIAWDMSATDNLVKQAYGRVKDGSAMLPEALDLSSAEDV